jgi:hypothetical protein
MLDQNLTWRTSSYTGNANGNCVEVALAWRKSSHSGNSDGNCVEVAVAPSAVFVRDTKDRAGGTQQLSAGAWSALLDVLR